MNNVKKVAAAVAMAIGTAGTGVVQSDIVDFGYGVSSPTVSTVVSVVNLERDSENETLHFRYFYKAGGNAGVNGGICEEVDFTWSTSPFDLVTVSPDGFFGSDTRGVLFNDPASSASYAPLTVSLALLQDITKPMRFKTIIDNNDGANASDNTLTAARATIIEHLSGAAWGYAGYNPSGNSFINTQTGGGFAEENEVFGEVIGPGNGTNGRGDDGVDVAIKPFDEFATKFFVQPIAKYGMHDSNGDALGDGNQLRKNIEAVVTISVADYTGRDGDAMFDRDENPVSSGTPQRVTCVGAVSIQHLLSEGAELLLEDTGGWGEFKTVPLVTAAGNLQASSGRVVTDEIVAEFLEYNDPDGDGTGGTFNGESINGVINNGYSLLED